MYFTIRNRINFVKELHATLNEHEKNHLSCLHEQLINAFVARRLKREFKKESKNSAMFEPHFIHADYKPDRIMAIKKQQTRGVIPFLDIERRSRISRNRYVVYSDPFDANFLFLQNRFHM
ncbi:hypothetical protein CEXT_471841 [Caerostris extrusa]|uniref:Uncharacterized protein n=1 Tax=Caerostris extrusa TaxID=172846 RepID=A0AAV4PSV4_CAEEX|nr:hypothetical protein CEXT_471841 [Caerostris extrusa]